ncbi:MAG: RNA polymerase sigma factor [Bacteroidota bacterium]
MLVSALKEKNREAFSYLYDNYSAALYGVINRITQNEEIANDVLQEAFVKIWKNIDNYSREKGSIYTWMLNVCRNSAIDEVRSKQYNKQAQNQSIDDNLVNIDASYQVQAKVDQIGLKKIVSNLRPEHRQLIDKVYFEGYTHDEISKELNMPLGTVKSRIRNAMIELRKVFDIN